MDKSEYHICEEKYNNQGCLMRIIEYNNASDIVIEFQDKYKTKVRNQYCNFISGSIKNPYYPSVYGVGITGNKYPRSKNCRNIKEFETWNNILERCYSQILKDNQPTYKDVSCCDEWLNYENFYEWLHGQKNFDKWYSNKRWAVDKDILNKGNKVYSSENCCLIPQNVNCLFLKREANRGDCPIGVRKSGELFEASCSNPFTNKVEKLGRYKTMEEAFKVYKVYKEYLIKQIAEIEFIAGNITEECYKAMMRYKVEIND